MSDDNESYFKRVTAHHPPVKPGYQRIYEDHTYRWFTDYTDAEIEEMNNDPFMKILNEEIQKEINREIIKKIMKR